MAWTSDQEYAITTRGKNTIVSAGAGSGKTAVLTERMFRIIKNKEARVDELLVLTFSNAAAHEMKDRIIAALRNDGLFDLADQIEGSNVTTFDAFSLSLVKKYSYYFSLPKDISIIEENILNIKMHHYIDDIFNRKYEEKDSSFLKFINDFIDKNDADIKYFITGILKQADYEVDKVGYLKNKCQEVFSDAYIDNLINIVCQFCLEQLNEMLILSNDLENSDYADEIYDIVKPLLSIKDYDELINKIIEVKFKTARGLSEEDKKLRETIKDIMKNLQQLNLGTSEEIKEIVKDEVYKNAYQVLFDIALEVDQKLTDFKLKKHAFSFTDIAKMALKLVHDPIINKELKENIKFIMVDEYQDTSDIQEDLVQALGDNNIFMVGDTKQSIYAFRNANCDIFQSKYENYKNGIGGEKIDLSFNFRSRHEVIDDLNMMFSKLMSKKIGAVDYKIDHITTSGNIDYDKFGNCNQYNNIEKIVYTLEKGKQKAAEVEATLIAEDIVNKINNDYKVYDKNRKELRNVEFKDFAILIDKKKSFDIYKKVFDKYQLPLRLYSPEKLLSSKVGMVFTDALIVVSSIKKETYDVNFKVALVGLMRSFVYGNSDEEIYDSVIHSHLFETKAYLDMKSISDLVDSLPLSELIVKLFTTLDVLNKCILIGNVATNEDLINKLIDASKSMEALDYSFDDFLEYINDTKKEKDIDAATNDDTTNVIKIMSIHTSKGLEFGIIYFPELENEFKKKQNEFGRFNISKNYGIVLPLVTTDKTSIISFVHNYMEQCANISERMRLFYVALTRTKEKSILLVNEENEKNVKLLNSAKNFLDFVSYFEDGTNIIKRVPKEIEEVRLKEKPSEVYLDNLLELRNTNIALKEQPAHSKASKVLDESINEELLNFGNQLHFLLELTDFISKDTSFIEDKYQKHLIDKVLQLSVFDDLNNATILKEYPFFDEINNVQGIIDLLIVKDDEIKIIDYKTKHIDDEAYALQLKTYANYIKQRFDQPIHVYLLSIMDAIIEEKNL